MDRRIFASVNWKNVPGRRHADERGGLFRTVEERSSLAGFL